MFTHQGEDIGVPTPEAWQRAVEDGGAISPDAMRTAACASMADGIHRVVAQHWNWVAVASVEPGVTLVVVADRVLKSQAGSEIMASMLAQFQEAMSQCVVNHKGQRALGKQTEDHYQGVTQKLKHGEEEKEHLLLAHDLAQARVLEAQAQFQEANRVIVDSSASVEHP